MTRRTDEPPSLEEQYLGTSPRLSPEEEAEIEQRRREEARDTREMLLTNLRNPFFRRWMMGKLIAFGAFDNQFGAGPTGFPDPYATFFAHGMKAAGWNLWTELDDLDPALASLMRREFQNPPDK